MNLQYKLHASPQHNEPQYISNIEMLLNTLSDYNVIKSKIANKKNLSNPKLIENLPIYF